MITNEQREMRKTGIGGSDVSAILGLSKYRTPLTVYMEKLGLKSDTPTNQHMEFGNELEPFILSKYADMQAKYSLKEVTLQTDIPTQRHKDYPFLLANVDGLTNDNIIVEAKNVGIYGDKGDYNGHAWGQQRTSQIPNSYLLQVAHYCMVMDKPEAHIVPYFGGSDIRIYIYHRNAEFEQNIQRICSHFWHEHVLKRVPPLDKCTFTDLGQLWKSIDTESKAVADSYIARTIQRLRENRAQQNELENEESALKSVVCSFMKENASLVDLEGNILASWNEQKRTNVNLTELRKKHGELIQSFTEEKTTRIFRLKEEIIS